MYLHRSNSQFFDSKGIKKSCFSHASASLDTGAKRVTSAKIASTGLEETKERIAKLIHKPELSISTYDTAWVAMVPSPNSLQEPCFPDCLNWLLENQCHDGSWARPHHHPLLQKDVLSSTLACLLALKKWGVGEEQINRGVHFIELNISSATEKCQIDPLGFDIIFPGMLDYARELFLEVRLEANILSDLIHKRDLELKSHSADKEAYLAYVANGMGKLHDWKSVMRYQRKNGSLFNSPSTTATAFIGLPNSGCLNYLHSAVKKFGNAVPAVYPLDIYSRLCTVDNLEKLGISWYFKKEIKCLLDETYRCWLQGDEEIFLDASTCGLAFRILRMNGYRVTSDRLTEILKECLASSFCGNMRDIHTTFDLYRASEIILPTDEKDLEKHNLRLKDLLELELSGGSTYSSQLGRKIDQEVNHNFQFPFYAIMGRVLKRRNIEHYNFDNTRILKTSYCSPNFGNKDFLFLSVQDFNKCQAIHRDELKELERWVVENRLDKLKFARSKSAYCYFSAASTIFTPEQSDARMSWAQNGVLTTVVDDFFDVGGSIEELKNLIQLVISWDDADVSTQCSSKNVQIIFSALRRTICEIGEKGFIQQERIVTNHIINIWLDVLNSMMKEAEWARDKYHPTMDEYMSNAHVSFALGPIVLPALYLVGPKLSEEMVHHSEFHKLYKLMSTCGRLLNDIQTCERELKDGKLNAIPLYMINSGDKITKEAAIMEMKGLVESQRRELLRCVMQIGGWDKAVKDNTFSVSKMYYALRGRFQMVSWSRIICYNKASPRSVFVLWLAIQKRLATADRLAGWGLNVDQICSVCKKYPENCYHLFFECESSKTLWRKALMQLGINRNVEGFDAEMEQARKMARTGSDRGCLYLMLLAETIYTIWINRNDIVFNQVKKNIDILYRELIFRIACRVKVELHRWLMI